MAETKTQLGQKARVLSIDYIIKARSWNGQRVRLLGP